MNSDLVTSEWVPGGREGGSLFFAGGRQRTPPSQDKSASYGGCLRVRGHLQTLTLFLSLPSSFPPFHPSLFQWRRRSKRDNGLLLPPLSSQQWRCILNRGRSEPRGAPLDAFMLSPPFTLLLPTIPSLCLFPFQSEQTVIFPSLNNSAAFEQSKCYRKSSFPPPSSLATPPASPIPRSVHPARITGCSSSWHYKLTSDTSFLRLCARTCRHTKTRSCYDRSTTAAATPAGPRKGLCWSTDSLVPL